MRNGQLKANKRSISATSECPILVTDIVRYLSGLSKLHESGKIGNPELSTGLRHVADALRPYAACPVDELADVLRSLKSTNRSKSSTRRLKATLPPNLEILRKQDIERILADKNYTKDQLAEVGFRRFGISRSKLKGLRKNDALNSIRAALDHENSLDVISKMARKAGKARAS